MVGGWRGSKGGSILVGAGGEVRGIHIGGGWRGSEGGPYWWGSGGEVRGSILVGEWRGSKGVHIGGGVEGK